MPWSQTMPMDQRVQFIADYLRNTLSMTELCDLYHVSRKTGYKWVQRYLRRGPIGLEEISRKPRVSPNQTPAERVAAILEARRHHPSWGAKKLLKILRKKHPRRFNVSAVPGRLFCLLCLRPLNCSSVPLLWYGLRFRSAHSFLSSELRNAPDQLDGDWL